MNSPPLIDGAANLDKLPEVLKEIQNKASLINSPASKNDFIERNYWGMVGEAAVNMEWSMEVLTDQLKSKSLYRSGVVRNSKKFLSSQLGANIDNNYASIGQPSQVETEEQLAFINNLHETIMKVELNSIKKFL